MRPVEGTILTVARGAAEGARAAAEAGKSLVDVVEASRAGAAEALARTPSLLPVLEQAGVVDAGGTGYLLLFDALLSVLDGRPMPDAARACPTPAFGPAQPRGTRHGGPSLHGSDDAADAASGAWPGCATRSCTCSRRPTRPSRRSRRCGPASATPSWWWAGTACGTATSTPTTSGRPSRRRSMPAGPAIIRVTDLLEQVEEERWVREAADTAGQRPVGHAAPGPPPTTGVVAVATGDGHRADLPLPRRAGAHRRRAVHEPVDRRAGRGGGGGPVRPR